MSWTCFRKLSKALSFLWIPLESSNFSVEYKRTSKRTEALHRKDTNCDTVFYRNKARTSQYHFSGTECMFYRGVHCSRFRERIYNKDTGFISPLLPMIGWYYYTGLNFCIGKLVQCSVKTKALHLCVASKEFLRAFSSIHKVFQFSNETQQKSQIFRKFSRKLERDYRNNAIQCFGFYQSSGLMWLTEHLADLNRGGTHFGIQTDIMKWWPLDLRQLCFQGRLKRQDIIHMATFPLVRSSLPYDGKLTDSSMNEKRQWVAKLLCNSMPLFEHVVASLGTVSFQKRIIVCGASIEIHRWIKLSQKYYGSVQLNWECYFKGNSSKTPSSFTFTSHLNTAS